MQHEDSPRAPSYAILIYGVFRRDGPLDSSLLMAQHDGDSEAGAQRLLGQDRLAAHVLLTFGELEIDTATRRATFEGSPVELTRREFELLAYLALDPARVFTRHELLRDVWGFKSAGATRTLDTHVSRLRKALAAAGASGLISSARGVGYRLAP